MIPDMPRCDFFSGRKSYLFLLLEKNGEYHYPNVSLRLLPRINILHIIWPILSGLRTIGTLHKVMWHHLTDSKGILNPFRHVCLSNKWLDLDANIIYHPGQI